MESKSSRRDFLSASSVIGAALVLSSCARQNQTAAESQANTNASSKQEENDKEKEVTATEDLMREHGILRRALLVYQESAVKLRSHPSAVAPNALQKTARLFRSFGEDYHEKQLEEAYIFPAVKRAGGAA